MTPYHNLLRPKAELTAAGVSTTLAGAAFILQDAMLFTPQIGQSMACVFLVSSTLSARRGLNLYRYHRQLSSTPPYTLKSDRLFKSESVYFIGRGFEWTAEHTKRMSDLYMRRNLSFLHATKREKKVKNWAMTHRHTSLGAALFGYLNSYHTLNPYPPRNATGTSALHGIGTWEGEEQILFDILATNHIAIYGGTGSGKTTTLVNLVSQDIEAGRPTIVIDPKGGYKIFSAMYDAAVRNGKVAKFKIIHLAFPQYSCQINPLDQYHRITEVSGRIAEGIDTEEAFKQFAWLKSNFISMGAHYLGEQPDFDRIKYYLTRCDELVKRYCRAYIERHAVSLDKALAVIDQAITSARRSTLGGNEADHDREMVGTVNATHALIEAGEIPDNAALRTMMSYVNENIVHERKLIRNIEPILEKLTTGSIAQIMVPDYDDLDSDRDILDWDQLIDDGGCVYIGTNALGDITVSSTFIQILLEKLTNYLGQRYQYGQDYGRLTPAKDKKGFFKTTIALHIDEVSAVKTKAAKNLLSRAGEIGVKLRFYTQSHADMVYTFGSRDDAESAIDNFGAIMMHRVNNPNTADLLVTRVNQVGIEKEGRMYGFADSSTPETDEDFSSSTMQREDDEKTTLLTHQNLTALPTGEAFILTNGQKLDKVRVPLMEINEATVPSSIRDMIDVMKRNDAVVVTRDQYEDTWFKSHYPEFVEGQLVLNKDDQTELSRSTKDRNESNSNQSFMPVNQVVTTLQSEIGSEAAEFSAQADTLSG